MITLLTLLACQPTKDAVDPPHTGDSTAVTPSGMDSRYLMAFFACEGATCETPGVAVHYTWVAASNDGWTWEMPEGYTPFEGSVPDLVRRDDTLYVYAATTTLRRYHYDTGEWEEPITPVVYGEDGEPHRWADPAPLLGDDGLIHMFFFDTTGEIPDPAECHEELAPCIKHFGSAIEIPGSDGAEFQMQPGYRAEVPLEVGQRCADPDVFRTAEGDWVMTILYQEQTLGYRSDTLHGTYTPIPTLTDGFITDPYFNLMSSLWDEREGHYTSFATCPRFIDGVVYIDIARADHARVDETITGFEPSLGPGDPPELPEGWWAVSPGFILNE